MRFCWKPALSIALFATAAIADTIYTFQPLTPCPGCRSLVSGINNSGQIAGSAYGSGPAQAFVSSGGAFTVFAQPGAFFTEAIGISNTGRATINYFVPDGTGRSYILEPDGTKTFLPVVEAAHYTLGGNVNDSGVAVGFYGDTFDGSSVVRAFVDTGTTLDYTFAYPGAVITQALGINNAGLIVGEYLTSLTVPPHGFVRDIDGTLRLFNVPGSIGTEVFDINNSGDLAGDYFDASGRQHGFIYRNGVFQSLDFGANTTIFAINDLGQAAGASYPDGGFFTGPYSGFVATPAPEPATWCFGLFVLGFLIIGKQACRNRQIVTGPELVMELDDGSSIEGGIGLPSSDGAQ